MYISINIEYAVRIMIISSILINNIVYIYIIYNNYNNQDVCTIILILIYKYIFNYLLYRTYIIIM